RQPQDGRPGFAWSATAPDATLVFTGQITAWAPDGSIHGDAAAQARLALGNLQALLEASGSGLDRVVKLNVSLVDDNDHDRVAAEIGSRCVQQPVPVSFVRTRLAAEGALVALDAVAVVDRPAEAGSKPPLPALPNGGAPVGL